MSSNIRQEDLKNLFSPLILADTVDDDGVKLHTFYGENGGDKYWGMGYSEREAYVDIVNSCIQSHVVNIYSNSSIAKALGVSEVAVEAIYQCAIEKVKLFIRNNKNISAQFLRSYYVK